VKYVYVLTSSEKDFYYEQFFLSVVSLRLFNPNAYILVLLDKNTITNLTGKRAGYEKFSTEIKIIETPSNLSQKEASRWIKTSIRQHVSGDFLFIDCDTIISSNLEYHFPAEISVGAVFDTHVPLSKNSLMQHIQTEDRKIGFESSLKTDCRYNGGLLYCKDDTSGYRFFEKWHSLWIHSTKKGISQDMPSLNQANFALNNIITELDGTWNCQISHNGIPFLYDARIIHYYSTNLHLSVPAFSLASDDIFEGIRKDGLITDKAMRLLKNPKAAFVPMTRIIADSRYLEVIDSSFFTVLILLRKKLPLLFRAGNNFGNGVKYFIKRHLKK
jgi:hypothetical protein